MAHTARKCLKRCSSSSAIKEMQTKTILRFQFTSARMAKIKETNNDKFWGVMEE